MIANYHTHTWRCGHASGTEEAYVRAAIDRGLKILGFSDHSPYFFPEGYYSSFRMKPEELPGYVDCIRNLRRKYANQLRMHIGLETEYYPKHFTALLDYLQEQNVEYMILGQHFLRNEYDSCPSGAPTDDEHILECYVRQAIDAMHTGKFTYFAHPDIIHYTGSDAKYRQWMQILCREAMDCSVPLELNLLGFATGRNYPDRRFLEILAENNCPIILGIDAHETEALISTASEKAAVTLANSIGVKILETVPLIPL